VLRDEAGRRGEIVAPLEDAEFIFRVARVVAQLKDPQAIPALAGALGTGFTVIDALVEFGAQAAPRALAVVMSPQSVKSAVDDGLRMLDPHPSDRHAKLASFVEGDILALKKDIPKEK